MLAFVMLWAYFSFSQYLIIWSGNLPEEIAWYLHRLADRLALRRHRADPVPLRRAVRAAAVARRSNASRSCSSRSRSASWSSGCVDLFWLIAPEFHRDGIAVSWLDVVLPLALGVDLARLLHLAAARPRDSADPRSGVRRGARPDHRARRRAAEDGALTWPNLPRPNVAQDRSGHA